MDTAAQNADQALLKIDNLTTSFFTRHGVLNAVDGVTIEIPKEKTVGIVGESGCGKSMTAMSVMGLVENPGRIVSGKIMFQGRDLTTLNKKEIRGITGDKIAMIFQEPMTSLNPVLTVGRQVREAIILHQNVTKEEAKRRVLDIFKQVGISDAEKRYRSYPHQLSGGLRQRVMIGMAMVCRPDLLIADEPTTALDVTIEAQILQLMKKLQKETKMSIMLITHNLGVVAEICDMVYVMYAGEVMEYADVYELFQNTLHPYTDGLIRSVPKLDCNPNERLYNIRGMVPNLLHLPKGCRFCDRCDKACPRCREEEPPLVKVSENHYVRCFLYEGEAKRGE
jgi:peptide/nickel transport system ATP-binding protein